MKGLTFTADALMLMSPRVKSYSFLQTWPHWCLSAVETTRPKSLSWTISAHSDYTTVLLTCLCHLCHLPPRFLSVTFVPVYGKSKDPFASFLENLDSGQLFSSRLRPVYPCSYIYTCCFIASRTMLKQQTWSFNVSSRHCCVAVLAIQHNDPIIYFLIVLVVQVTDVENSQLSSWVIESKLYFSIVYLIRLECF